MEPKQTWILVGVMAAVAITASALILISNSQKDSASAGNLPGLQTTDPPWQPEYKFLAERIKAANIPPPGRETYHVHARMNVYTNGKQQPVPMNVGLNPQARVMSALHTHDATGIIHIEADAPRDVKLSEFFTIWGVKFSDTQLGSFKNEGNQTVRVFVNGKQVDNPVDYQVQARDSIVVGYGAPGSFPTTITGEFPTGL